MRLRMNGPNGSSTFLDTGTYAYPIVNGGSVVQSNPTTGFTPVP